MAKTARVIYRYNFIGEEVPAEFDHYFEGEVLKLDDIRLEVELEGHYPEYLEFLINSVPVGRYSISSITPIKLSRGDSIRLT